LHQDGADWFLKPAVKPTRSKIFAECVPIGCYEVIGGGDMAQGSMAREMALTFCCLSLCSERLNDPEIEILPIRS